MNDTNYNPARRLHDIISAGPSPGDGITVWNAFSEILGVPVAEPAALWERIAQVMQLPATIKSAVETIPDIDSELYLTWHPKAIAAAESFNVKSNWKSFASNYPPENRMALNFCADLLSKHHPERRVPDTDLTSLLQQVNQLIQDLDSVEFRSTDWHFMYHHLSKVKEVIESYMVTGIRPLEDAYAQTIGGMAISPNIRAGLQGSDLGKRFWKAICAVATVLSVYGGISAITHDTLRILNSHEIFQNESPPALPSTSSPDVIDAEVVESTNRK